MEKSITINQTEVMVKEYNGQRVVTLKDIDNCHGRLNGTARKRFNDNKRHFIEGTDYFIAELTTNEIRTQFGVSKNAGKTLTLITKSGYLMLVKSLTDDFARRVPNMLVERYFRVEDTKSKAEPSSDRLPVKSEQLSSIKPLEINYNGEHPTVLGRDLHKALGVKEKYTEWFKRMCSYGFENNTDYILVSEKAETNNPKNPYTTITNHQLTIPMAKEICMLQRSEQGKKFRQYFISVEEKWNSPEAIMARALQFAKKQFEEIKGINAQLEEKVAIQGQQMAELKPKVAYYDLVLNCKDLMSISSIAKDYGKSAIWLNDYLHDKGIQFKQGNKIWLLYQKYADKGYTGTKTHITTGADGEAHTKVHTYWTQKGRLFIYELLKNDGILPLIEQW